MKKKFRLNRLGWLVFPFLAGIVILLPNKAQVQDNLQWITDLSPLDDSPKQGDPKMESILNQLQEMYFNQGIEKAKEFAKRREIDMVGDLIRVVIEADSIGEDVKAERGIKVSLTYIPHLKKGFFIDFISSNTFIIIELSHSFLSLRRSFLSQKFYFF